MAINAPLSGGIYAASRYHRREYPQVVTSIIQDLNRAFEKEALLAGTSGKIHDYYVEMTINYSITRKVKFSMFDYLEEIIRELPVNLQGKGSHSTSCRSTKLDQTQTICLVITQQQSSYIWSRSWDWTYKLI